MQNTRSSITRTEALGDWPACHLKTTTEVWRHVHRLESLFAHAKLDGLKSCRMIEIGPGAAVAFLAEGLTRPDQKQFSLAELRFQSFRFTESVLRHFPGMPLRSLEPVEIAELAATPSSNQVLGELIVVDRDRRVLRAAQTALAHRRELRADLCSTMLTPLRIGSTRGLKLSVRTNAPIF